MSPGPLTSTPTARICSFLLVFPSHDYKSFPHCFGNIVWYNIIKRKGWITYEACDKITLDKILQHKEHFDQKLIEIVEKLEHQSCTLSNVVQRLEDNNQQLRKENSDASLKIKNLQSQKYGYDKKYLELKNENDDLLKYLKDLQKEIDELKKENEQQKKEIDQQGKNIKDYTTMIDKLNVECHFK